MVRKWIVSLLCLMLFSLLLCACSSMMEESSENEIQTETVESGSPDVMEQFATDSYESEVNQEKRSNNTAVYGAGEYSHCHCGGRI